jgi:hypothetical protein
MAHSNEITAKVVSIQGAGTFGDITNVNDTSRSDGSVIVYNGTTESYDVTNTLQNQFLTISAGTDYTAGVETHLVIATSSSVNAPLGLANGEFAYSLTSQTLYLGDDIVGGEKYTTLLDSPFGLVTGNKAVIVDSNKHVDELHVGSFSVDTSGGTATAITSLATSITDSSTDSEIPTALAVETRIQEVHEQDTHVDLATTGSTQSISTLLATHGNGQALIIDDTVNGDGVTLDSTQLGLEYLIINIGSNDFTINTTGTLSWANGTGTTGTGTRTLQSSGVATVMRTTESGVANWVIFGNGGLI